MGSMICCLRYKDSQANEESSTDEQYCKCFNFCMLFKRVTSTPATAPHNNSTISPQEAITTSHQLQARLDDTSAATKPLIDVSHEHSGSNPFARNDGRVGVREIFIEEEDVCPICLEGFVGDNPSTCLECSHEYHLACILNWMERSPVCPMCAEVIILLGEES